MKSYSWIKDLWDECKDDILAMGIIFLILTILGIIILIIGNLIQLLFIAAFILILDKLGYFIFNWWYVILLWLGLKLLRGMFRFTNYKLD